MDSRDQKLSRQGIYLRLSPEIKQQVSAIVQNIENVHDQLGLPKTHVDTHDVLVDLVKRGFKSYQSDKNKLH
tara:strand:+ start:1138 stop:1353 length:216 start_codon:yes stop_codon:yes gene_type:complete